MIALTTLASAPRTVLEAKWHALGPFASGKTEYEGDPLAAHGGAHAVFHDAVLKKQRRKYLSEYAGWLEWMPTRADQPGVALPHAHVDWQSLHQRPPAGAPTDVLGPRKHAPRDRAPP